MSKKITSEKIFRLHADKLAPYLLGKLLCADTDGETVKLRITETECYMGTDDLACHASKGRTERTSVMFENGGLAYVYLVYGMHNMFNVVCGEEGVPEAVLIRCCEGYEGPAKLTKRLKIDRSHNRENLMLSNRVWLEDDGFSCDFEQKPRVGVDYAGEYWSKIPWRFVMKK